MIIQCSETCDNHTVIETRVQFWDFSGFCMAKCNRYKGWVAIGLHLLPKGTLLDFFFPIS